MTNPIPTPGSATASAPRPSCNSIKKDISYDPAQDWLRFFKRQVESFAQRLMRLRRAHSAGCTRWVRKPSRPAALCATFRVGSPDLNTCSSRCSRPPVCVGTAFLSRDREGALSNPIVGP
jgi:hypothetical protein